MGVLAVLLVSRATEEQGPVSLCAGYAVSPEGLHAHLLGSEILVRLERFGRVGTEAPVAREAPRRASPSGLSISRGRGVSEWFRPTERGVEHGFDVEARLDGTGPLSFEVAIAGLEPAQEGAVVRLHDSAGDFVATYSHLAAIDSMGARLPARMEVLDGGVRVVVDDTRAIYPIVVDPLFAPIEGMLVPTPLAGVPSPEASTIAISGDGSRVLLGGRAVRAFARTGSSWADDGPLLLPSGATNAEFGYAVALSADGLTAVVGAPLDDAAGLDTGSARVYVRRPSGWQHQAMLVPSDPAQDDWYGSEVALSADGTHAFVGTWADEAPSIGRAGSVSHFVAIAGVWSLVATLRGRHLNEFFGAAIAIDATAERLAVGAARSTTGPMIHGSVTVYARSGSTWTEEARFDGDGHYDSFGEVVGLSAAGDVLVVGVPSDDTSVGANTGSLQFFRRTGSVWALEASALRPPTITSGPIGGRFAVAGDGTLVVGSGPVDGTLGVWEREGTAWRDSLSPSIYADGERGLPAALALSSSGDRLAVAIGNYEIGPGPIMPIGRVLALARTLPQGAPCDVGGQCTSRFCFDGVCCDGFCGGVWPEPSLTDCRACAGALTGLADGTCGPLSAAVAPTIECRSPVAVCDAAERCVAGQDYCPDDVYSTEVCRPRADVCDAEESCSGSSIECPADSFLTAVPCRPSAGGCDLAETCLGDGIACPADEVLPAGIACRPAASACDVAEACDGTTSACPPESTSCGVDGGFTDSGSPPPPPVATSGCACRQSARGASGACAGLLIGLLASRRVRGRSRAR